MNDRAALYAAICADPDDDTPRLVFADWLDEHGEAKRAAYIRAHVERHRRENADTPAAAVHQFSENDFVRRLDARDWREVDPELGELYAAVERTEKGRFSPSARGDKLPRIKGVTYSDCTRGFFSEVDVGDTEKFIANAGAIFRAAPITAVRFDQLTAAQAREFVRAGHLARVRELVFGYEAEPAAVRLIGSHRDAAGVRRLELECGDEAHEQFVALAAGPHWTGVRRFEVTDLDMEGTRLSPSPDRAVADLVRRPAFRRLEHLTSWGNNVGDATARAVATAGLTELRHLDLAINIIGETGAAAIAASKQLPNLRYLDIGSNDFGGEAAAALIASPRLRSLTVLRLESDNVRGPEVGPLTRASRGPTLRVLCLQGGALTTRGLTALAKCPATHGLWFLSMEYCSVSDSGLAAFIKHSGVTQLTVLDLGGNKLTARGMKELADWPAAAGLRWLDVSDNKLYESGAKVLAASPHLTRLTRLGMSGRGTAILRKKFGKKVVP